MSPPNGRNGRPPQTPAPHAGTAGPSTTHPQRNRGLRGPHLDLLCDFCGTDLVDRPFTRFGCREFAHSTYTDTAEIRLTYVSAWSACRRCAPLVRARAWRQLTDRLVAVQRAAGQPAAPDFYRGFRSDLAALWLVMAQHLTGDEQLVKRGRR